MFVSRQPLVQNSMLSQRDDLPRSARAPWQVLKEHAEEGADVSAQVKKWYQLACQVGFEKTFACIPAQQQQSFIDVSHAELVAFVLWRRLQKKSEPRELADAFDDLPSDDQAMFTAPASEHEAILKAENMFFDVQAWSRLHSTLADSAFLSQAQNVVHANMENQALFWPDVVSSRFVATAQDLVAARVSSMFHLRFFLFAVRFKTPRQHGRKQWL